MTGLDAAAAWLALSYGLIGHSELIESKVGKYVFVVGAYSSGVAATLNLAQWMVK